MTLGMFPPRLRGGAGGGYIIEGSAYPDGSTGYLSWTPASAGNQKTFVIEAIVKLTDVDNEQNFISAGTDASNRFFIKFNANGTDGRLIIENDSGGAANLLLDSNTSFLLRDVGAWLHIVVAIDTTQATDTDRARVWLNGTAVADGDWTTSTYPSQNADMDFLNTTSHAIFRYSLSASQYAKNYAGRVAVYDSLSITDPETDGFGELTTDGYWEVLDVSSGFTTTNKTTGGTNIGNMTSAGGLAAAFDGTVNAGAASARVSGATGTVGKQWSSAKTITQYIVKSPTDDNFGGTSPITIKLQGSNDGAAWTDLHTDSSIVNTGVAKVQVVTSGITTSTAYTYHRIEISGGGASTTNCAELEFYEDVANSFGTNGFLLEGGTNTALGKPSGLTASVTPTSGDWTGNTGDFTISSGSISNADTTAAAVRSGDGLHGDFEFTFTLDSSTATGVVGVFSAVELSTFANDAVAGMNSMTNAFYIRDDSGTTSWLVKGASNATESTETIADGSVIKISRVGSTFYLYDDDVLIHTWSNTYAGAVYVAVGWNEAFSLSSMSWTNVGPAWAVNGTITATNDSPTDDATSGYGNYATINANQPNDGTFSNGNLTLLQSGGSTRTYLSTIKLPSTGKWRFKYTVDSGAGGGGRSVGILDFSTQSLNALLTGLANNWVYDGATGNKYVNGSGSAYGSTWTTGDSVEVLYDADAGTVEFYKNTTSQGTIGSVSGDNLFFAMGAENAMTFTVDFGQNDYTTNDSSFSPLATQNITPPSVNPSEHACVLLYDGDGAASNAITGAGAEMDFWLLKDRDSGTFYWGVFDRIRGAGVDIHTNSTSGQYANADGFLSFDSDGFTVGADTYYNTSGHSNFALGLKAGGAGSSNTDGSITSTVSANTTSGFSIVYVNAAGTGAAATIGHGLGVPPAMIIAKELGNTNDWRVYHRSLGNTVHLQLNTTNAVSGASAIYWNNTDPTSTVFSVGSNDGVNRAGGSYIYYCFADVADLATSIFRIGSYTGNTSTDGPMITQDASILGSILKRTDTGGYDWYWYDSVREPTNPVTAELNPNTADAEAQDSSDGIDYLSNGMKNRAASNYHNNGTIIYMHIIDKFLAGGADAWTQGRAR